jgi:hypothetical protein
MPESAIREAPITITALLDRLDRMQQTASEERRELARAWHEQMRAIADDAKGDARAASEALGQRMTDGFAALGQRIADLGAATDKRMADQLAAQASARMEQRAIMLPMLLIIAGLSGLQLWLKADGSAGVAPAGAVQADAAPVMVEDDAVLAPAAFEDEAVAAMPEESDLLTERPIP